MSQMQAKIKSGLSGIANSIKNFTKDIKKEEKNEDIAEKAEVPKQGG